MRLEPYKAHQPTKWERRLDNAVGLLAPALAERRIVARERMNRFRYLAAQSNPSRRNAPQGDTGDTVKKSREKMQVMWNAIELVENSGLCKSILHKIATYVCGTLRYQARTGDNVINNEYEDYMRQKCGRQIDYTKRFSLRTLCMLDIKGIALKGDIGTNIVRDGDDLFLQGIEADRIGNPNEYSVKKNYVRGLSLNDNGQIVSAKIFSRDRRNGVYVLDDDYPMWDTFGFPRFLFLVNPISFDDYRGVSVFATAIDNATYIEKMRNYELQAMLWASSQAGVYYTKSGLLPDKLPFDANPPIDSSGNVQESFQIKPNTITSLQADGEKVEMFPHERPSPNVLNMYINTIKDIALGTDLSFGFCYDYTGLTGPAVRQLSGQDARAIQTWQDLLRETKLEWIQTLLLGNAIANGELPYHPNWNKGAWFFPAKITIDVGRESAADINERDAGLNAGADIAAERSQDIDEIQKQLGIETGNWITIAKDIAGKHGLPWEQVYMMLRGGKGAAMAPAQSPKVDAPGATSDGVDIGEPGEEEEPDKKKKKPEELRQVITIRHEFGRTELAADDDGSWITIDGAHVHIGGDGKIDKGPAHLIGKSGDRTAKGITEHANLKETGVPIKGVPAYRFGEEKGELAFYSKEKDYAEEYAIEKGGSIKDVKQAAVTISNPLVVDVPSDKFAYPEYEAPIIQKARESGHDGVIFKNGEDAFYVRFLTKLRQRIDVDTHRYSAFTGDCLVSELPEETVKAIHHVVGRTLPEGTKVARYGMTAVELLKKADPHNIESAQKNIKRMTVAKAAEEVHSKTDKHVLLHNDKVIDGHHYLAKAIKGKVTKSLAVLDLSPIRFQNA